jgi:valyl-tRNA synthetase
MEAHRDYVVALGRASEITIADPGALTRGTIGTVADGVGVALAIAEGDRGRARQRLEQELRTVRAGIDRADGRLGDQAFVARAPEEVVEEERRRSADLRARERVLTGFLGALG